MTDAHRLPPWPPIIKVVTVKATPERAFTRFTTDIASWWPLASHSVGEDDSETVMFEERVGGRIVERLRSGQEAVWGTVTAWEPPHRVAFTWHPGSEPERATFVEVLFSAAGPRTRVELRHSGFERLGPEGARIRRMYPIGWLYVLGLYAGRRGPAVTGLRVLTTTLMAVRRAIVSRRQRASGRS